ncbi:uncharacterized protein LAESUDRAFT_733041 [Laetiporus sulphureus 93-53]|uniref:Uncharacterized protein n=1 Tax=Laetiporus sulphureus 93-53 TaxID=1314785 RepID=A0A165AT52_9APHY|nr:uncharacterized protein LAESUDRAFT_733041 [Laetiporus sulphureus 93-53]KZS99608.1 hypothetical protein LAESUDRAFT_733041 [Laetiporus sulphureus 93-53]
MARGTLSQEQCTWPVQACCLPYAPMPLERYVRPNGTLNISMHVGCLPMRREYERPHHRGPRRCLPHKVIVRQVSGLAPRSSHGRIHLMARASRTRRFGFHQLLSAGPAHPKGQSFAVTLSTRVRSISRGVQCRQRPRVPTEPLRPSCWARPSMRVRKRYQDRGGREAAASESDTG